MTPFPLRPTKGRVFLKRVQMRTALIHWVGEQIGITDGIYQLGEVLAKGPAFISEIDIPIGALIYFTQSRVFDHFQHGTDGDGRPMDVLVYPGEHINALVTETFLADNPKERRYVLQPL